MEAEDVTNLNLLFMTIGGIDWPLLERGCRATDLRIEWSRSPIAFQGSATICFFAAKVSRRRRDMKSNVVKFFL